MFLIPVVILLPMAMAILAACFSKRSPFLRDALVVGTGIATFGCVCCWPSRAKLSWSSPAYAALA